jgi:hypothetical protein
VQQKKRRALKRTNTSRASRLTDTRPSSTVRKLALWCQDSDCYTPSNNYHASMPVTHTIMNSGVLNVQNDEQLVEFWERYKEDYDTHVDGLPLTYDLSEIVSGDSDKALLYLFVEIDAPKDEIWPTEYPLDILKVFTSTLRLHRPCHATCTEGGECIEGGAKAKASANDPFENDPNVPFKCTHKIYGSQKIDLKDTMRHFSDLHIQTKIAITPMEARFFIAHFLMRLNERMPRPVLAPWEVLLNVCVYEQDKINLRMNYSHEAIVCPCQSKTQARRECTEVPHCNFGNQIKHEMYRVTMVLDEIGRFDTHELQRLEKNMLFELHATSIRPRQGVDKDPLFLLPPKTPHPRTLRYETDPLTGERRLAEKQDRGVNSGNKLPYFGPKAREEKKQWENNSAEIPRNSELFDAMTALVRAIRKEWSHVVIGKLISHYNDQEKRRQYLVCFTGIGANYCLNRVPNPAMQMQRCHRTSNCIGIIVKAEGWSQWCLCGDKKEDRVNGPCNIFRSGIAIIPLRFSSILFPGPGRSPNETTTADPHDLLMAVRQSRKRVRAEAKQQEERQESPTTSVPESYYQENDQNQQRPRSFSDVPLLEYRRERMRSMLFPHP